MFRIAKIKVLKLRDKTQTRSIPRAVCSHQVTATTTKWKKGFSSCWLEKMPPWWGTRGGRYWSNCKAEQHKVLSQTFNYKRAGKTRRSCCWKAPGGRAEREGSKTVLIRSGAASCPHESEATPAFSLIKNIFKTKTEHLRREPKRGERVSPEATLQNSAPERSENSCSYSPAKGDKVQLGFIFQKQSE